MLARRLPINTKTKLDLTILFVEFHNSNKVLQSYAENK